MDNIQRLREKVKYPVLIFGESNLRYFTGVAQSGVLIVDKESTILTHDAELARTSNVSSVIRVKKRTNEELVKLLKGMEIRKLGANPMLLGEKLVKEMHAKKIKRIHISKALDEMRAIKPDGEIKKIRMACELADEAMSEVRRGIRPGVSERELRQRAMSVLVECEDVAFSFIVASGPNSEYTHISPTSRRISLGEFVIIDLGFKVDGYSSDLTRTFCISPSKEKKHFHDYVLEAQKKALEVVSPGAVCGKVYDRVLQFFKRDGSDAYWKYSLGHGVGLDVHESPMLSKDSKDRLKNGMTFTIEPGLHIPGFGGVRIEDTFLLDKKPIRLTDSEYSLEP